MYVQQYGFPASKQFSGVYATSSDGFSCRILRGWPVSALIPGKDEFVSQSTFQTTGKGIGTFDNFVYFS